jgi:hypothetical protein
VKLIRKKMPIIRIPLKLMIIIHCPLVRMQKLTVFFGIT